MTFKNIVKAAIIYAIVGGVLMGMSYGAYVMFKYGFDMRDFGHDLANRLGAGFGAWMVCSPIGWIAGTTIGMVKNRRRPH